MATTSQKMNEIIDLSRDILEIEQHNHDLLHLLLRLQGITKQKIDELLAARHDEAAWERLIGTLKAPTAALADAVKKNQ